MAEDTTDYTDTPKYPLVEDVELKAEIASLRAVLRAVNDDLALIHKGRYDMIAAAMRRIDKAIGKSI